MRSHQVSYLMASSLVLAALATATPPPPTPPPTTPAQQPNPTTLPSASEQCLAPPSQQAANRRYLRQLRVIECENYHATRAANAAPVNGETAGRNYNGAEVDARHLGSVVDEIIPPERYPDLPALDNLDTYDMLDPNPDYADFLRGIEMAPTTGAMGTGRLPTLGALGAGTGGNLTMPEGMWPIVVGALILFARAAGSRRRRPAGEADDVAMKVRLGEGR